MGKRIGQRILGRQRVPGLAPRLKQARKEAWLSQEEAAFRLGVARHTVSNWETKTHEPSRESLEAVAQLYGKAVAWFLGAHKAATEPDIIDPDLNLFFQGEWGQLTETEQGYVRVAVRMAREAKQARERESGGHLRVAEERASYALADSGRG